MAQTLPNIEIAASHPQQDQVLTEDALAFLASLHKAFHKKRQAILKKRHEYQRHLDAGHNPEVPPETESIRQDPYWKVKPPPPDLEKRWVEITGPTDKKMVINALNSGADAFMADFEDATSPTWKNLIEGQINLSEAINKTLSFTSPEGKAYKLNKKTATLMCRPRGWHLHEKHLKINGEDISASLFDFGLYFFRNAKNLLKNSSGPYFYLPKLEHYEEARLWEEVFVFSEEYLQLGKGTIRATVLIETITAAFQMEEILYELREHITGLNAGRWDYIFSIIKKLKHRYGTDMPDRSQVTMSVGFMKVYASLLVRVCHKREAYAIGGMAAFIPSRKDPEINKVAFAKVYEDKEREAKMGFDGTWVAHPDLVQIAREPFQKKMGMRSNQIYFQLPYESIRGQDLIFFSIPDGKITEKGIRTNINVTIRYLAAWFSGVGAVGINNLMEDAATAEISRAQLWQWAYSPFAKLDNGKDINIPLIDKLIKEEYSHILNDPKVPENMKKHLPKSKELLERAIREPIFPEFITVPAYLLLE